MIHINWIFHQQIKSISLLLYIFVYCLYIRKQINSDADRIYKTIGFEQETDEKKTPQ